VLQHSFIQCFVDRVKRLTYRWSL